MAAKKSNGRKKPQSRKPAPASKPRPSRDPIPWTSRRTPEAMRPSPDVVAERLKIGMPDRLKGGVDSYVSGRGEARSFIESVEGKMTKQPPQNLLGFGLGIKPQKERGLTLAMRVYVRRKLPLADVAESARVPRMIGGLPTDVVEVGSICASPAANPPKKKKDKRPIPWASKEPTKWSNRPPIPWRTDLPGGPIGDFGGRFSQTVSTTVIKDLCARRSIMPVLEAGVSIGPDAFDSNGAPRHPWAGTLGYFVRRENDPSGPRYILSNNHVLANWTSLTKPVDAGTLIAQPGVIDDNVRQPIARLTTALTLNVNDVATPNLADVAIAELDHSVPAKISVFGLATPLGVFTDTRYAYQTVVKAGRTTGPTLGLIYDLDANIWVEYAQNEIAWFEHQIGVMGTVAQTDFSQPGDSGSLVLDYLSSQAVGLLFAGSEGGLTFVNPIEYVLNAFGEDNKLELIVE